MKADPATASRPPVNDWVKKCEEQDANRRKEENDKKGIPTWETRSY